MNWTYNRDGVSSIENDRSITDEQISVEYAHPT